MLVRWTHADTPIGGSAILVELVVDFDDQHSHEGEQDCTPRCVNCLVGRHLCFLSTRTLGSSLRTTEKGEYISCNRLQHLRTVSHLVVPTYYILRTTQSSLFIGKPPFNVASKSCSNSSRRASTSTDPLGNTTPFHSASQDAGE